MPKEEVPHVPCGIDGLGYSHLSLTDFSAEQVHAAVARIQEEVDSTEFRVSSDDRGNVTVMASPPGLAARALRNELWVGDSSTLTEID